MFGLHLTKIARKSVEMVLGQFANQIDTLDNIVRTPMQSMVNDVTGGAWVGQGADAFVQEVTNRFIPVTDSLKADVSGLSDSINNAIERFDEADSRAQDIVGDIVDSFDGIF